MFLAGSSKGKVLEAPQASLPATVVVAVDIAVVVGVVND